MNNNKIFYNQYDTIFKNSINIIDIPKVQNDYIFVDTCNVCDEYIIIDL